MFGVWASLCLAVGAAARDAPVARETDFFSSWLRRSALFDGSSPWAPGDLRRDLATLAAPEHLAALVERTEAVDVGARARRRPRARGEIRGGTVVVVGLRRRMRQQ